jgi:hypothetical protein
MDEHAARVRIHRKAVAQEIDAILDSDPDADHFAERMSDDRPPAAAENLALVRGTDPRPAVMEKAERRSVDIKAAVWRVVIHRRQQRGRRFDPTRLEIVWRTLKGAGARG